MQDEYGIGESIDAPEVEVELAAVLRSGKTREEREAETAALLERANDPSDDYDGHHGDDRTQIVRL